MPAASSHSPSPSSMSWQAPLLIGYRYWRSRKANAFASFITFFAVTGIFLGVAALIIVSSVMNGLEGQLKQRILDVVPQMTIDAAQPLNNLEALQTSLEQLPQIKGVLVNASTQAMLQSPKNIAAVQLYGIEPTAFDQFSNLSQHLFGEGLASLNAGDYQVLLGEQLARSLGVTLGDTIRILSGEGVVYSPLGPVPSQRKFVVGGIFVMGSQVDSHVAYIHYQDARRLMRQNPQDIDSLRLYFDDPFQAPKLIPQVQALLATQGVTAEVSDWRVDYGQLFAAVKMEKSMMSLMIGLIIAVAAFNIVSALVMMVIDKTADIAVLKTQGMSNAQVMMVFIYQGSFNALLGLLLGLVVGIVATLNMDQLLNALGISILGPGQSIPTSLDGMQITYLVIGTLLLTFISTIYPAKRAANVHPAVALRYE